MSLRSQQNATLINKLLAITFSTPHLVEKAADALNWRSEKSNRPFVSGYVTLFEEQHLWPRIFVAEARRPATPCIKKSHVTLRFRPKADPDSFAMSRVLNDVALDGFHSMPRGSKPKSRSTHVGHRTYVDAINRRRRHLVSPLSPQATVLLSSPP